jgi:gluconate 5-dehydrogenase
MDELERFRLDGKVALVPGGSGGIGARICEAFARVGGKVAVVGRSQEALERAHERIVAAGGQALALAGDMTVKADADRVVERTLESWGRVDVLVNAVGGGAAQALYPAESYPEESWDWIVALNLKGALFPSQACARAMIEAGRGGAILNVSSVRGQLALNAPYSAYVAAKHALNGLTKQHATEWAKYGIRVNAISPTFVRTEQVAPLLADPDFEASIVNRIPLGRIADPDDLVGAALFFCSDASGFVTGQILVCDGGLTATQ